MLDLGSTLDARFFGLGSMLDARFLMVLEMPAVTLAQGGCGGPPGVIGVTRQGPRGNPQGSGESSNPKKFLGHGALG